jgi:hypothetical protein
MYAF